MGEGLRQFPLVEKTHIYSKCSINLNHHSLTFAYHPYFHLSYCVDSHYYHHHPLSLP